MRLVTSSLEAGEINVSSCIETSFYFLGQLLTPATDSVFNIAIRIRVV